MPMFDADTFIQQTIDKPLETEYVMVPPGEYVATIDDFTSEAFRGLSLTIKGGLVPEPPASWSSSLFPSLSKTKL